MPSVTMNATLNEVEHVPPVHKRVLDVLPGISGGIARVMVGQPFDTIKTRLQVMGAGTALAANLPPSDVYLNSNDCLRKMVKNEGWVSLYRGVTAPLLGNMVLLGIHFPTFSRTRKMLEQEVPTPEGQFSHWKTLVAGGAAGLAGSLVSCPSEHVRTKMQLQRRAALAAKMGLKIQGLDAYKGSVDCAVSIVRKHGVAGLYRGFTATVIRDIQGYAWFFYGYEATVAALAGPGKTKADLTYSQVMLAGIVAGFGLWGSMFPIDTVKSKLQGDSLSNPQYKSTYDCYKQSVAVEGQKGLWRGFSAAMYRAIPVNASIFLAVEGTRNMIQQYEQAAAEQTAQAGAGLPQ
ncbi:mitochondrial carrier domain-containing protein [Haematococcus lacustris]